MSNKNLTSKNVSIIKMIFIVVALLIVYQFIMYMIHENHAKNRREEHRDYIVQYEKMNEKFAACEELEGLMSREDLANLEIKELFRRIEGLFMVAEHTTLSDKYKLEMMRDIASLLNDCENLLRTKI